VPAVAVRAVMWPAGPRGPRPARRAEPAEREPNARERPRPRGARATGTHAAVPRCPTGATGDRTGLRMAERAVLRDARSRARSRSGYRARDRPGAERGGRGRVIPTE